MNKTKIMSNNVGDIPQLSIDNHKFEMVDNFTYLGSNTSSKFIQECQIYVRIGRASTAVIHLAKRARGNVVVILITKMKAYKVCALNTLLYESKSWTF